jgi:hypothetical protein
VHADPVEVTARTEARQKAAWQGEPPRCDACRRRLLAGERALTYHLGERDVSVCPLCAVPLGAAGLRRSVVDADPAPELSEDRPA